MLTPSWPVCVGKTRTDSEKISLWGISRLVYLTTLTAAISVDPGLHAAIPVAQINLGLIAANSLNTVFVAGYCIHPCQ